MKLTNLAKNHLPCESKSYYIPRFEEDCLVLSGTDLIQMAAQLLENSEPLWLNIVAIRNTNNETPPFVCANQNRETND